MAIRTGMQTLVDTVRGYTNASTAEWSITTDAGSITFWDDTEIQRVLDRHKFELVHEYLAPIQSYSGGSVVYLQYHAGLYSQQIIDIESGTAVFKIEDVSGTVTGWTMDYARGVATFAANQAGKSLWFSGFSYDLNAAAADIWRMKASHAAEMVDFATDGHNVKRSQQAKACLEQAAFYQSRSQTEGAYTVKITRDDL